MNNNKGFSETMMLQGFIRKLLKTLLKFRTTKSRIPRNVHQLKLRIFIFIIKLRIITNNSINDRIEHILH
jgi:hypothetical protein